LKEPQIKRCDWAALSNNPLMIEYHDKEWGVPVHDDRVLFEFLTLEGAQAGLTWQTILNRRENYRKAFHGFDPSKIASYGSKDTQRLLGDSGIIRNRLKIQATITNAKQFLAARKEFGSFDNYIWRFVNGKPIKHKFSSFSEIPPTTKESGAMSEELRERGFKFVGPTICYAFMQAVGMVNDHSPKCFRYNTV
jgi:DNA-3-methyladenine glycosylase I